MSAMSRSTIPVYPRLEDTDIFLEPYSINVEYTRHDPNRQTLVLLHGYLGSISDYYPVMDYFEEKYNIIAIDLRGHGGSAKPEAVSWGIQDLASDIKQVLDILVPVNCKVTIVASSMATAIALELGNSYPGLVERIFLMSATSRFRVPSWVKFIFGLERITPLRMTNALIDTVYSVMSKFATEEEKDFLEEGLERFRKMGLETHRRLYEDAFSLWEANVENLTQPIFIMAGEDDKIVSIEGTLELVEQVESSTLLKLKDQEHHIILTRTDLVISLIEEFMENTTEMMKQKYYSDDDLVNGELTTNLVSINKSRTHESITN